VLVRVAVATHARVADVAQEPYVRTLWTFFHLGQQTYVDGLSARFLAVYKAGLMSLAFGEPKKLRDSEYALRTEAGLNPTTDALKSSAQPIIDMVAKLDALESR
jgi:hypothetical protein